MCSDVSQLLFVGRFYSIITYRLMICFSHISLRTRPARLVESHLRLTLHSSLAGLGPLHAILSKRRGKVVTDTMVDGTDLIRITATIPQAESFVSAGTIFPLKNCCCVSSHVLHSISI